MKILITGIAGFVGSHLAEYALLRGAQVCGWVKGTTSLDNLKEIRSRVQVEECDMQDKDDVARRLESIKPDWVFHLAAKSHIGESWKNPLETLRTNSTLQVNLLEAVRMTKQTPRILLAGSSEEYGIVDPSEMPICENRELKPASPYAVSKVSQDLMGLQYFQNYKLPIVRTRAFNQTGPRRHESFVTSAFARQVAMIQKKKSAPVIHVGNLEAVRDFTDVRDAVLAYWLALEKGDAGEVYNICSGRGIKIGDILQILKRFCPVDFEVKPDPAKMRPSDLPVVIGNGEKFFKKTGWKPKISFEDSLQDLLDEWLHKV